MTFKCQDSQDTVLVNHYMQSKLQSVGVEVEQRPSVHFIEDKGSNERNALFLIIMFPAFSLCVFAEPHVDSAQQLTW